jgi:hypothetical protein
MSMWKDVAPTVSRTAEYGYGVFLLRDYAWLRSLSSRMRRTVHSDFHGRLKLSKRLPIRLPTFPGVGIVAIGEAGWSVVIV